MKKMNMDLYREIKNDLKTGFNQTEVAEQYGLSQPTVHYVKRSKTLKEYFRLANPNTR